MTPAQGNLINMRGGQGGSHKDISQENSFEWVMLHCWVHQSMILDGDIKHDLCIIPLEFHQHIFPVETVCLRIGNQSKMTDDSL